MKRGTSFFALVFLLGSMALADKSPTGLVMISDQRPITNAAVTQSLRQSTFRAQDIFSRSVQLLTDNASKTLAKIASLRLGQSMLRWPRTGTNFRHCNQTGGPVAFTLPRDFDFKNIFLCHKTLFEYFSEQMLSQILIHESIHLAGVLDECEASLWEKKVMTHGAGGLAYYTGHMRRCGIEP
jgi:hypothetical protein